MRGTRWMAIPLGVCLLAVASAVMNADGPNPDADQVARLIRQLGDDSFAVREAASAKLHGAGEAAIPALQAAAATNDLELRLRVRRAIAEILLESKSTKMSLVLIAPADFEMGSQGSETGRQPDEFRHRVRLSDFFLIGEREVTQTEYQAVMQRKPSRFSRPSGGKDQGIVNLGNPLPVECVSWFDAVEFCNRLSELDGFPPYYRLADVERSDDSIANARVSVLGDRGYRLPTEAEWEYACRAGTTSPFHFGTQHPGREANFKPSFTTGLYGSRPPKFQDLARTAPVGSYPSNQWGLSDVHGNVAEWCWDWYNEQYYATSPRDNPKGPDQGRHRVVRGGSWLVQEVSCRSASRFWLTPDERKDHVGFRVARTPRLR